MRKIATTLCACLLAAAAISASSLARTSAPRAHTSDSNTNVVSGLDKEWLKTSLEGDLFEVRGGKIALKRSHKAAVRKLARRLITDHAQSYQDGAQLAKKLGIEVPDDPTPSEVWELRTIRRFHGHRFNFAYASLEVYDHVQDIQETSDEIQDGNNSDVVGEAKKDLPMLKDHLKLARETLKRVQHR